MTASAKKLVRPRPPQQIQLGTCQRPECASRSREYGAEAAFEEKTYYCRV